MGIAKNRERWRGPAARNFWRHSEIRRSDGADSTSPGHPWGRAPLCGKIVPIRAKHSESILGAFRFRRLLYNEAAY
jgi:hypothetical protein